MFFAKNERKKERKKVQGTRYVEPRSNQQNRAALGATLSLLILLLLWLFNGRKTGVLSSKRNSDHAHVCPAPTILDINDLHK